MGQVTAGSIAKRLQEVPYDQYERELDLLLGIRTRPNGARYLDPNAPRMASADTHSFAEIGEAILGPSAMRKMRHSPYGIRGGIAQRFEAAEDMGGAMSPSQFSAINYWSGTVFRFLEAEMLAQFNEPEFLGSKLSKLKPGTTVNVSRRGRYSPPTVKTSKLQPNEPIPLGSLDEEFIDTNPVEKNGQALAVSSEAVLFDGNQGALVQAIGNIGYQIAWTKEDKILKPVLGIHNTYAYGTASSAGTSTSYNTYNSAAPSGVTWQNDVGSQELVDESDLDVLEQLFLAQVHPRTGYPINIGEQRTLLVMPTKKMTAARLQRMTSVQVGAREASPNTVAFTEPIWAGTRLDVVVSQRAFQLMQMSHTEPEASGWTALTSTQAGHRHFYGDPSKAFEYREVRPFQSWSWNMTQDPSLAQRDCFMMVVGLEQGSVTVVEPRHVIRAKKDS